MILDGGTCEGVIVRSSRARVWLVLAIVTLLTASFSDGRTALAGDLDRVASFDIPAQPLDKALLEFGDQAHVQIMFAWDPMIRSVRSHVIKGRYTAKQALSVLLDGTRLEYEEHGNTVTIARDPPPGPAQSRSDAKSAGEARVQEDKQKHPGAKEQKNGDVLEEVTVTGTYIRGTSPIGSPLIVYSHEAIEESGAATIAEFARQIPENFSGADILTSGLNRATQESVFDQTGGNIFGGSAFNINGIGASATLTLLDGHRLAPGGADGSFVDASLIPLSAVERIEILPDGASAIYGSDAVAGVVNIITRKDFEGAETGIRYGRATAGGAGEMTASQLAGSSWSSGNVMMSYEYDGQSGLDAAERDFIPDQGGPDTILPPNWRNSVLISGNQKLGSGTSLSADAIYSAKRFHSQFTVLPTGETDRYDTRNRATVAGLSLTLRQAIARDWSLDVTGLFSRMQQVNTGLVDFAFAGGFAVDDRTVVRSNTSLTGLDLLVQGSVLDLPGGELKAAVGGSFEAQRFVNDTSTTGTDNVTNPEVDARRHEVSAFAELVLPIVGASNSVAWTRRLELSTAARMDRYSDFGQTINPKLGLTWSPGGGLNLRASYGTSYRAPLLSQLAAPEIYVTEEFPDPTSASGLTDTLYVSGGNRSLRPERSRSFSVGPDLEVHGLSAGATYFHTHYTERVGIPPVANILTVLADPVDAPFVTRNPPLSTVEAAFDSPGFQGDYAGLGPAGVSAIFNSQYTNLAATTQSSVDVRLAYRLATTRGTWMPSIAADRQISNELRASPAGAAIELLDLYGEPVRWKVHGALAWTRRYWGAALGVNYLSAYHDQFTTPPSGISSWTTADVHLSYRVPGGARSGLLGGVTVALTVENVTDQRPPYVAVPLAVTGGAAPIPYDPANASPVGRVVSLEVHKQWAR
jgi:iron complex outermembrane receptor protein